MGVLYGYVPNEGTAWQYTLDVLSRFYEGVLGATRGRTPAARRPRADAWPGRRAIPARRRAGADSTRTFRRRDGWAGDTAALHRAVRRRKHGPGARPGAVRQAVSAGQCIRACGRVSAWSSAASRCDCPTCRTERTRDRPKRCVAAESDLTHRCRAVLRPEVTGQRVRVHGNYHLGELLYTAIGVRGDRLRGRPGAAACPNAASSGRRLRDVADMVRSLHYAALTPLYGPEDAPGKFAGVIRARKTATRCSAGRGSGGRGSAARFVRAYSRRHELAPGLLPSRPGERAASLLELFMLYKGRDRARCDELEHRPARAAIPLILGLLDLLGIGERGA